MRTPLLLSGLLAFLLSSTAHADIMVTQGQVFAHSASIPDSELAKLRGGFSYGGSNISFGITELITRQAQNANGRVAGGLQSSFSRGAPVVNVNNADGAKNGSIPNITSALTTALAEKTTAANAKGVAPLIQGVLDDVSNAVDGVDGAQVSTMGQPEVLRNVSFSSEDLQQGLNSPTSLGMAIQNSQNGVVISSQVVMDIVVQNSAVMNANAVASANLQNALASSGLFGLK